MSRSHLHSLALAAWLAVMAVLALLYMTLPPSPDQSQFDWMAFIATEGQPFYVGSFDMNWPGEIWLHEAGIRLFGLHAWTWRLTDFLLMAGFTTAGAVFLSRSGWRRAPFVFLFLYPPLYVSAGGWMAGQRDIISTGFLLTACMLAMSAGRREVFSVVAAGLMVAAAVLTRPTFMGFLAGMIVLEWLPLKRRSIPRLGRTARSAGLGLGFVAGMGAAAAAGLYLGNLDDWYRQSIEFSLSVYAGEPAQDWRVTLNTLFVQSWHWITLLALIGLGFWVRRDGFGYALVLTLGLVATSAISFVVQNKGFGYHLGGVFTVLVLYLAVAFDGLENLRGSSRSRASSAAALAALALAVTIALVGTASKVMKFEQGAKLLLNGDFGPTEGYGLTERERREIIEIVQAGGSPDGKVIVYGTNFDIAYRTKRLPSHRFINVVIDQARPSFPHYQDWMEEIDGALQQTPPAFMIFGKSYLTGPIERPMAVSSERPVLERLVRLLSDGYRPVFGNESVLVYARSGVPHRAAGAFSAQTPTTGLLAR